MTTVPVRSARPARAAAGIAVAGGSLLAIAFLAFPRAVPPPAEPVAPPAIVVVRPTATATPPLTAPAPPAVTGVVAAPADAFVGAWREPGGARLTVERVAADRYDVVLAADGSTEHYDGVLNDGRVQIARGIDGEWIQAVGGAAACLKLGATRTFCRG